LGRSYRPVLAIDEYVGPQQDFAKVKITKNSDLLELIITASPRQQKRYLWNNKVSPLSKVIGKIPVILFAPHHVNLVADDPAVRRNDLDDFLSTLSPAYAQTLARYKKILQNRNALLKHLRDRHGDTQQLNYWTSELLKLARGVFEARFDFMQEIEPFLNDKAKHIYHADAPELKLHYMANTSHNRQDYYTELEQKFAENQHKEIIVGQTLYGPHKDDYSLIFNDKNLRYLGSRGEQRIAVFIWKLAQHQYLQHHQGVSALLLIDDLMSELDNQHRQAVGDLLIKGDYQFILAAAEESDVPNSLISKAQSLKLGLD
jgi:DNA replication and repair protein RecF